jgi:hypothetical protein
MALHQPDQKTDCFYPRLSPWFLVNMPLTPPGKIAKKSPRPGAAWRAAEEAGIDMLLLEHSLRLTMWERIIEHQRAFEIIEQLVKAKVLPKNWRKLNLCYPAILREYGNKPLPVPQGR